MSNLRGNAIGVYRKYDVTRTDGSSAPGGKHADCAYFVLDLEHDEFAIPALKAYATACRKSHPLLAAGDGVEEELGLEEELGVEEELGNDLLGGLSSGGTGIMKMIPTGRVTWALQMEQDGRQVVVRGVSRSPAVARQEMATAIVELIMLRRRPAPDDSRLRRRS